MIKKIKSICNKKHIKYLIMLLFGMLISAVIEMVGLGSIPLFIMIILDIDIFDQNTKISQNLNLSKIEKI